MNLEKIYEFIETIPDRSDYFANRFFHLSNKKLFKKINSVFEYELSIAGITTSGQTILDAGCGAGIYSILFLLKGAKLVSSVDFFPDNIRLLTLVADKFSLPIDPICCDISQTPIESKSIDIVFCTEAISHFHDYEKFLVEANRVLRPGGKILISDWNNGASPILRQEVYRFWKQSECGPFTAEKYEPGKTNLPYLFRRWMIIRRNFKELSDDDVFHIGLRTVGKGGSDLIEICENYSRNKVLPEFYWQKGISQIRPEDGQKNEEPINPIQVKKRLYEMGIKTKVFPYFGYNRSKLLPAINSVASKFGRISLLATKKYILFGVKQY